mmetsp:Transcript_24131/g.36185  ORF Transcript_24131/g.36185 Transcript_24131/m.36185 type:complete len:523 (+) Transcript_24131:55-1623(+)
MPSLRFLETPYREMQPLLKRHRPPPARTTRIILASTFLSLFLFACVGLLTTAPNGLDLAKPSSGPGCSRWAPWRRSSPKDTDSELAEGEVQNKNGDHGQWLAVDGRRITFLGLTFDGIEFLKSGLAPSIGVILSIFLAFSPWPAILRAKEIKSLTTNPAPYPAMFANASNWVAYAFIIKDPFVFVGNVPGMVMGLYYTISAFDVSKNKDHRRLVRRLVYGYATVFPIMVALLAIFIRNEAMTTTVVANFSMVFLILFYGAPLITIKDVFDTKNASSLDPRLAWCCFANAVMWTVYGFALKDVCVWFPNILGAILATIQLTLLCIYPSVAIEDLNITGQVVFHRKTGQFKTEELKSPAVQRVEVSRKVTDQKEESTAFRQIFSKRSPKKTVSVPGESIAFVITDEKGIIKSVSEKFLEMTKYSLYEVINRNCNFLQFNKEGKSFTDPIAIENIRKSTRDCTECHVVLLNYTKEGEEFWNLLHIYPLLEEKEHKRFIGVQEELSVVEAHRLGGRVVEPREADSS